MPIFAPTEVCVSCNSAVFHVQSVIREEYRRRCDRTGVYIPIQCTLSSADRTYPYTTSTIRVLLCKIQDRRVPQKVTWLRKYRELRVRSCCTSLAIGFLLCAVDELKGSCILIRGLRSRVRSLVSIGRGLTRQDCCLPWEAFFLCSRCVRRDGCSAVEVLTGREY